MAPTFSTDRVARRPSETEVLDGLAAAAAAPLAGATLDEALAAVARAAGPGADAALAVVRVPDGGGGLAARAVWAHSAVLGAELEGSRLTLAEVGTDDRELTPEDSAMPPLVRRSAARVGATCVRLVPVLRGGVTVASLELYREAPFDEPARAIGHLAGAHVAIALELGGSSEHVDSLELAGDALAAGSDELELADHVVRLALAATRASSCLLWRIEPGSPPALLARHGRAPAQAATAEQGEAVRAAVSAGEEETPSGSLVVALGQPPVGALELEGCDEAEGLTYLAARVAVALRRTRRAAVAEQELVRSETIVEVLGEAIARLSLSHTLDTAVERISELAGSGQVGIYLRAGGESIEAAASRGLHGPHTELTERLLELALGPHRGRGFLVVEDLSVDPRLAGLQDAIAETGVRRALVVPLVARDEVTGVLAVYEPTARPHVDGEEALPLALSAQLAVAVQNARLHEHTEELKVRLQGTLDAERRTARQLRGLYAISDAFARSLSFDATLDAVVHTMADQFELDAAVLRLRGPGGETATIHVSDPALRPAAEAMLGSRNGGGELEAALAPFLAQGATAVTLPLATPGELLGTLTLLRLDPHKPLDEDTLGAARTVAAQAALALDNARLYQQQKDFTETMQRSLLPVDLPTAPGIEIGHVYESSARVDVGGDVYDALVLEDGRLAVCLGDVSGKGIQAAADMAMAKFAFRALARTSPEPAEFLARVNEVVHEEISIGKFVTMVYAVVEPAAGELATASAGHPPPRLVAPDGTVRSLGSSGLALGVEPGQGYEQTQTALEPGACVVLFTDGVTETRREGELYGDARLDAFLRENAGLAPQQLVDALVADCRAFGGGELGDDCAVVCLRRATLAEA